MSKNLNENMLGKVSGGNYEIVGNGGQAIFGKDREDQMVKQELSEGKKKINLLYANDAQGNTERENFLKKAQPRGAVGYAGKTDKIT